MEHLLFSRPHHGDVLCTKTNCQKPGRGGGGRGIKIDRAMNNWANCRWLNYIWDNHSRQAVNMVGKFTTIDTTSSHCNELNIQDPSSCRLISSCFDTQENIKGTNRATKLYTYHQKKKNKRINHTNCREIKRMHHRPRKKRQLQVRFWAFEPGENDGSPRLFLKLNNRINPLTLMQAVTGPYEPWPFFHFWCHHFWPKLASSSASKRSFQWCLDQGDRPNGA